MSAAKLLLAEDRYFDTDPARKEIALELYRTVAGLPLICPHGHVDPKLFADATYTFGSPTELLIIPDHYVFRMLYSQGIPLEALGIPARDETEVETDHRRIWQIFADHYYLFLGTPTGMWLNHELYDLFGVRKKLTSETAGEIYDQIAEKLASEAFNPRRLYERFNIEALCTTDPATSTLADHQAIRESGWQGRILPTFRPDSVVNLEGATWRQEIERLSEVSGVDITDYYSYIEALEQRRAFFKAMGASATDHAAVTPYTVRLMQVEVDAIFDKALRGQVEPADAVRFTGHMLMEMARMSVEDGLVMQLHPGSLRSHNQILYERFGSDMGGDIPLATEYTRNLQPLLNAYGNNSNFSLILFTLDETTFVRELAPLAGHYPAVKLGPPWWFLDSWNGMTRYREYVSETAGLYNTVGFNDDTRAYPSIPARHDLARRVDANWIAGLVARQVVDMEDGREMIHAAAYGLAKRAYKL
jgi:glucuronate isomerase